MKLNDHKCNPYFLSKELPEWKVVLVPRENHYGLNRVKARTEKTEILWIFFGVMTSNAVKIAKRRKKKRAEELKAQKQVA